MSTNHFPRDSKSRLIAMALKLRPYRRRLDVRVRVPQGAAVVGDRVGHTLGSAQDPLHPAELVASLALASSPVHQFQATTHLRKPDAPSAQKVRSARKAKPEKGRLPSGHYAFGG